MNKLKVMIHEERPFKYMLANKAGVICGGNAMIFIRNQFMTRICYPTVFSTRREAESMIDLLEFKL